MTDPIPSPSPILHWPATRLAEAGARQPQDVTLAEEVPVSLSYNTLNYAVMMASPQDIEDFAVGFSLTEGIVDDVNEIKEISLQASPTGLTAALRIPAEPFHRLMQTSRRMIVGRTGCGVCGTEDAEQLLRPLTPLPPSQPASLTAIRRALAALADQQTLNRAIRMAHAAAWCTPDGTIHLIREDLGRHNALDKLIGAALRTKTDLTAGFCLLTSRCSYEMAQKAIIARIPTLVAISAPTGLALRTAAAANLTLLAIARPDAQTLFTGQVDD